MKKSIDDFVKKASIEDSGIITGGFGSIKGGKSIVAAISDNPGACSNSGTSCSGSNSGACVNAHQCSTINGGCNNQYNGCTNS